MSFTQTYINHESPQNATLNNARCIDDKSKGSKELKRKSDFSKENGAIQFDGPSSDGQSAVTPIETEEGFKNRKNKATEMIREVRSKSKESGYFAHYFGATTTEEIDKVKNNYGKLETNLPNASFAVEDARRDCYAFVRGGSQPIHLCVPYRDNARESGKDSKPGVIIHEESHIDLKTKDHIYNLPAIYANGSLTKEQAMENAETYEYAAENVAGI